MIAALVRTDPARRAIPVLIAGGVLVGMVLRGIQVAIPGGIPAGSIEAGSLVVMLLAATAWGTAVAFLMMTGVHTRGHVLSLGLPVPAGTVWLARMASISLAAALPVGTMTLVAAIGWEGGPTVHLPSVELGARLLGSLVLLAALVQMPHPTLRTLPWSRSQGLRFAVALALSFVVAFAPVPAGWIAAAALAAAGAAAARTFGRIPPAFSCAPREVAPAEEAPAATGAGETAARGTRLRRALARVLVSHAAAWFILPLLVLYGFQTLLVHHEGSDTLLILLFPMIWIPFVALHSMSRIAPLDPLPIPRRRLFRWCVLPAVAAYLAGLAIYVPLARLFPETLSLVRLQRNGLRTPAEFWEFAPNGQPPSIVAPWGEAHAPRARALIPGLGTAVYFPFEAPADASPRYFAWQARRAVAAVHGGDSEKTPAPDEGDPLVRQMEARGNIRYSENVPGSAGVPSATHVRTLLTFGFGPPLFWLLFGWMGMHPRLTGRARGVLLALGLGIPVALVVVTELAVIGSGVPSAPLSVAASSLARKFADSLPIGTGPLAACVVLFGVVVYRLLGRWFERFEAPLRPAKTLATAWRGSE
jgi:hypothetical protein